MPPVVIFQDVSKKFGSHSLIDNVSFEVESGSLTTLIGPNGAGKTTIARLMLGLEKPTSGNITTASGLKFGYVPQKLDFNQSLPLTSEAFVKLIAPAYSCRAPLDSATSLIDIESIKDKDISTLSGGQFQKLLLTATLLSKPDVLILDEPLQSLDAGSQQEFYRVIDSMIKQHNTTVFMISHDLFTVMRNSHQVICLNRHICCSGKPGDLNNKQEFIDALSVIGVYSHHHDHKH